jgi:hypothetical protein
LYGWAFIAIGIGLLKEPVQVFIGLCITGLLIYVVIRSVVRAILGALKARQTQNPIKLTL